MSVPHSFQARQETAAKKTFVRRVIYLAVFESGVLLLVVSLYLRKGGDMYLFLMIGVAAVFGAMMAYIVLNRNAAMARFESDVTRRDEVGDASSWH